MKKITSEYIDILINDFLASGGEIQKIPAAEYRFSKNAPEWTSKQNTGWFGKNNKNRHKVWTSTAVASTRGNYNQGYKGKK